jgi:sugar/nucleoside kinase (ribokinase family)
MRTVNPPTIVTLGAHVLDTLVYPVEAIPDGQGAELVEQVVITAAGTAGGTALVLARLGARVLTVGAIGQDVAGDLMLTLLGREGVDVTHLHRTEDEQTSASVLPIREDGSRPALHVIGANVFAAEQVPWTEIAAADHLHLGAPELIGPDTAVEILSFCREHGVSTSVDALGPGSPEMLALLSPILPFVDYLLPNDEQALGWTGMSTLEAACEQLRALGAACVVATAGGNPIVVVDETGTDRVPAFEVRVVDTTGCGDAFSAGFIRGVLLGRDHVAAAELGAATAAMVVQGIGTDWGQYDLERVLTLSSSAARLTRV